jgi:hypothetical protein
MIQKHVLQSAEKTKIFWNFAFNYLVAFGGVTLALLHFC